MSSVEPIEDKLLKHFVRRRQARKHQSRADNLVQSVQGYNVRVKSEENYRDLCKRLRDRQGPLASEMREYLRTQKEPNEILTPQEKIIFEMLIQSDWLLKHVTPYYDLIQEQGNVLYSVEERKRRSMGAHSHTPSTYGTTDNLFFSFGPGDIETVRFLDGSSTEIVIDYKTLLQDPVSSDGFWSSDHFYAYNKQQTSPVVNVYGTLCTTKYRNILDPEREEVGQFKICTFQHPNGEIYTQKTKKGDEIFSHPRIDIALVLLTIEKIRLLGRSAWEEIVQETNLLPLQHLVHTFFHPGVFEVHKPVSFALGHPSVSIKQRSEVELSVFVPPMNSQQDEGAINNSAAIQKIMRGQTEEVLAMIDSGLVSIDSSAVFSGVSSSASQFLSVTYTLLAAAILSGQEIFLRALLDRGVRIESDRLSPMYPLEFVFGSCNASDLNAHLERILPGENVVLEPNPETVQNILRLLFEVGASYKENPKLRRTAILIPAMLHHGATRRCQDFQYIMPFLKYLVIKSIDEQPVFSSVFLDSVKFTESLLEAGGDVNQLQVFHPSIYGIPGVEFVGSPLLAAVWRGALALVSFLAKQPNIDLETRFSRADDFTACAAKITELDGFTPLLLAVRLPNLEVTECLLQAGANIFARSSKGDTVFSIAEKFRNKSMLALLNKYLPSFSVGPLEEFNIEAAACEIQVRPKYVIVTGTDAEGQRFFLLRIQENGPGHPLPLSYGLPFYFSCHKPFFDKADVKDFLNEKLDLKIEGEELCWQTLGSVRATFVQDGVDYAATIILCDAGKSLIPLIKRHKESDEDWIFMECGLMFSTEVELLSENSYLNIPFQEKTLAKIVIDILHTVSRMDVWRPFSTSELQKISESYNKHLTALHALQSAARTGNISQIEALLERRVSLEVRIPTIEEVPYSFRQGTAVLPLETAIQHSHRGAAELLKPSALNTTIFSSLVLSDGSIPSLDPVPALVFSSSDKLPVKDNTRSLSLVSR